MSIDDEREDEDVETVVRSMPLVINEDIVSQYGETFSITLDENLMPVVAAIR